MKKFACSLLLSLLPLLVLAQGWPAGYGGVMLQGFFWDSYKEAPDCSPWGPWQHRQNNSATQGHRPGYTWATMYGAGWGTGEEWQVPVTTWRSLLAHKAEITPFIDLIWLPQSGSTVADSTMTYSTSNDNSGRNGVRAWRGGDVWRYENGSTITNPDCMGFVPVFYFHHGMTFNADGTPWTYTDHSGKVWTPMSYFGTEAELRQLISEYKAAGTGAIEDVVANHRGGLGTWSGDKNSIEFPSEYYKGELIEWTSADVCNDDESGRGTGNADCGGRGEWARDIDHHSAATRAKVIKFLDYLKNDLGYVGYRYDYAMGFEESHFAEYNTTLRPTFSVGEYWGSQDNIGDWIKQTYAEGNIQSAAFDFPLMGYINDAFNNGNYRGLDNKGLIADPRMKRYAVTFVDNHDTFKDLPTDGSNNAYQHRTNSNIVEANAFILAMPGTPCLFWPHFMHPDWHDQLCRMILARRAAGVTNEAAVWAAEMKGNNGIQWRITGNKGEVYLQLGEEAVNSGTPEGFTEVYKTNICRYSITTSCYNTVDWTNLATNAKPNLINGYAVVDKTSGSYNTAITVNVKPSSPGCVVVYSTNGQDPTAGSKRVEDVAGVDITISETTDLRAGVLVDGKVVPGSVVRNTYVIDHTQASGSHKVYIYVPESWTGNPYIYAWDDGGNLTSSFPGWELTGDYNKKMAGVTWREATINSDCFDMIISYGNDDSKTANITGIDHDVFYTYKDGVPYDVTATYVQALHNPDVAIDVASGRYTGNLVVNLIATREDATIVYTTDGSEPTPTNGTQVAFSTQLTFDTDGTHQVRAGILWGNEVINPVARSYFLEGASPTNSINVYVKNMTTNDAPHIYAWDNNQTALTGNWEQAGTQLTQTATNSGQTWYKYTFDRSDVNLLFMLTGDKDKTANISITAPGDYYYYYYPGAHFGENNYHDGYIDVTNDSRHTTTAKAITVFMYDNGQWANILKLYPYSNGDIYWNWAGSWAEEGFPKTTINGQSWYYATFMNKASIGAIVFNGNNNNERYEVTGVTSEVFIKFPGDNNNWNTGQNVTSTYASGLPAVETPAEEPGTSHSVIPSCATYVPDAQYIYFENDKPYSVPFAWVWDGTTVFSGTCWPGEALVDLVGLAPNGNAVYRWTYTGEGTPTGIIFNDNGGNDVGDTQTSNLEFVNGGYYSALNGLEGVVTGHVTTLAGLIQKGDTQNEYVISDDLNLIYTDPDGHWLLVKDQDGDAVNPSAKADGQKDFHGTALFNHQRGGDFDQSNWALIRLAGVIPQDQYLTKMMDKNLTVMGQTVMGRLTDALNPTITLTVDPLYSARRSAYQPNTYIPSSFVEQTEYFFVKPKAMEYAQVVWAVYNGTDASGNHIFTVPEQDGDVNANDLDGALTVTLDEGFYAGNRDAVSFQQNVLYELTGIVKRHATGDTGAPRHTVAKGGTPSPDYSLSLVSYTGAGNIIITEVDDLTAQTAKEVKSVTFYNVAGRQSATPFEGINIVVTRYTDGSTSTSKMLNK